MPTSTTTTEPRISGADIIVPNEFLTASSFDTGTSSDAMFDRLRQLKWSIEKKVDKNELAIVMIEAAMHEGVCTKRAIVAVLKTIGLNAKHVSIIIDRGTGMSPVRHRWSVASDGRYNLLVAEAVEATPP